MRRPNIDGDLPLRWEEYLEKKVIPRLDLNPELPRHQRSCLLARAMYTFGFRKGEYHVLSQHQDANIRRIEEEDAEIRYVLTRIADEIDNPKLRRILWTGEIPNYTPPGGKIEHEPPDFDIGDAE
jgi:hypothetical protein